MSIYHGRPLNLVTAVLTARCAQDAKVAKERQVFCLTGRTSDKSFAEKQLMHRRCLLFFLIYWSFLIAGEELADRGQIGPFVAMWLPNWIVGLGGVYLVVSIAYESRFFTTDPLRRLFRTKKV